MIDSLAICLAIATQLGICVGTAAVILRGRK
jgi:hypothetical protein